MSARTVPSSQKLLRPRYVPARSLKVLKESSSSSGGAKSWGCPANITRSNVDPERGGDKRKIAGGFFVGRVRSLLKGGSGGISGRFCATCADCQGCRARASASRRG